MEIWRTADKISIVVKKITSYSPGAQLGIHQGYVVFGNNKKQLDSAINWAGSDYHVLKDIPNRGFKIKILNSAGNSSQGGKLSFWNCIISNIPSKEFSSIIVGINSSILAELINSSIFEYGVCTTPVLFASCEGRTCVIHNNMPSYKRLMEYIQSQKSLKSNKSMLRIGHLYESATMKDVYLGEVAKIFEFEQLKTKNGTFNNIRIFSNPILCKFFVSYSTLNSIREELELKYNIKSTTLYELLHAYKQILLNGADNAIREVESGKLSLRNTMNLIYSTYKESYTLPITRVFNRNYLKKTVPKRIDTGEYMSLGCTEAEFTKLLSEFRLCLYKYANLLAIQHKAIMEDKKSWRYGSDFSYYFADFMENIESCYGIIPEPINKIDIGNLKLHIHNILELANEPESKVSYVENVK